MPVRFSRDALAKFLCLTLTLLFAGALLGCGGGKSTTPSTSSGKATAPRSGSNLIGVKLTEYKVLLDSNSAGAGKVTFTVKNAGKIKHEFVVLKTTKKAADLMKGNEADESGNVGEIGDVEPGKTKKLTLKLKPGHYSLICNLPGHYAAGQYVDFNVNR